MPSILPLPTRVVGHCRDARSPVQRHFREAIKNHLEQTGRYHDTLIEHVTLDLKSIRPSFLATIRGRYRGDLAA
jgi:hypothetical protein